MIGVTHLFGCNENKPIDGAFSHRPEPPQLHILSLYPSYKWQTDSGSGDIAAARGERGSVCVCVCRGAQCVCADLSACHFAYTADVYDGAVSAAAHQLINLC